MAYSLFEFVWFLVLVKVLRKRMGHLTKSLLQLLQHPQVLVLLFNLRYISIMQLLFWELQALLNNKNNNLILVSTSIAGHN